MSKIIYQDTLLYPKILWQSPVHKYKATAGKVMVIAGSRHQSGVAILACEAVFRSGTGILLLGFPESLKSIYHGVLPDAMTLELPETPGHTLAKKADGLILENAESCDAIIIGPGLSENAETTQLIWELLFNTTKPVVLCEDGTKALIKGITVMRSKEDEEFLIDYFKAKKGELILVLDIHEANKLAKALKIEEKIGEKDDATKQAKFLDNLSQKLSSTVVLRSRHTVMTTNTGVSIITRLAASDDVTSDSGLVLACVITSFIAQNPEKHLEALATAIYLYELAINLHFEHNQKQHSVSSDIIRYLPRAIKKAEEN